MIKYLFLCVFFPITLNAYYSDKTFGHTSPPPSYYANLVFDGQSDPLPSFSCKSYNHHNARQPTTALNLYGYTAEQLRNYFKYCGYSEQEILDQHVLYLSNEFVKLVKTYPGYNQTIECLHQKFKDFGILQKAFHTLSRTYSSGLKNRIHQLYNEIHSKKINPQTQHFNPRLLSTSLQKNTISDSEINEYMELESVYKQFIPSMARAVEKRCQAYNEIKNGAEPHTIASYTIHHSVKKLLRSNNYNVDQFVQCRGNQLQQIIHQESLAILEQISILPTYSIIYPHQSALVDCAASLCDYNNEGLLDKATCIADLCWTLLDYGQAIVEGAGLGLYTAAQDILTNPIEATVCIVAGKQVLAYQLCKVLYNVANIGLTAITDYDTAKEKWDNYLKPINDIIAAIQHKEITIRESIKAGTALAVGWKAQSKLLGGMGKFCNTIQQKALRFAQNNISSFTIQEYLSTPEGYLLKSIAKTSCNASCPNQYEHLKQWLKIKEFTAVIKTSKHGIERLIERGFTPEEIRVIMQNPTLIKTQTDGALAYIKQIGQQFNVIVLNEKTEEVVTVLKHTTQKKLDQMGKNYGWK
jgi:hypothetical protein